MPVRVECRVTLVLSAIAGWIQVDTRSKTVRPRAGRLLVIRLSSDTRLSGEQELENTKGINSQQWS